MCAVRQCATSRGNLCWEISNFRDIRGTEQSSAQAMTKCPYCKQHRSRRTRACIRCKARALPSCRPERCMILPGLRIPISPGSEVAWTLCRGCFRESMAMMFLVQATRHCQWCQDPRHCQCYCQEHFIIIAEVISHYCGGPWTENLNWFYWGAYERRSWRSDDGERAQEEIPDSEPWHPPPIECTSTSRTRRWTRHR